ncbi:PAS domain S-box protein [Pontibacter sp. H249]|uniref:PAS domain S-box protein n=1 Tax=Pontibacter sp. H249 TaxID=3133420 RepID=UPI0030BB8540
MLKGDKTVFEKMLNLSSDLFGSINREGFIVYISEACQSTLGYQRSELLGQHISEFLHSEEIERTNAAIRELLENVPKTTFCNRNIHKNGTVVYIHWSVVWSEEDNVLYFVGREITNQKPNAGLIFRKDEPHQALCEHGSDMLALFNANLEFTYSSGSTARLLGYSPDQLIGVNALTLVHPNDLPLVEEKLALVLASEDHDAIPDFRFQHANGEWRWLETSLSNQLGNPAVCALVTSTRDVTEKYLDRQRLMESEQLFRSMFEENPDTVLIEDREGVILDANKAAEGSFGIPRAEIIGKHITDFIPPDTVTLCMQHLSDACEGKIVRFELSSTFEGHGELVLDITKIPMSANGKVKGVYTVVKNITAKVNFYKATEEHARKLITIFESITDAFCTIDRNWKYTYVNNEFERLTGFRKEDVVGKTFFELYPNEGNTEFYRNYRQAMETGNSAHFDAYSPEHGNWFELKVFPSTEGISIYFSDITDKVKAQQEVKRLSLVASSTTNGVVILDLNRRVEWVNEGFTKLTGYSLEEAVGKMPLEFLAHEQTDEAGLAAVKEQVINGQPIAFEVLNKTKDGKDLWLSIKENPILGEDGRLAGYVSLQTDITAMKKYQQELELLSLVASKTTHGVIITGAEGLTEWVNEGFTNLTGYSAAEIIGRRPGSLLHGAETDQKTVRFMREMLNKAVPFNTNIINYRKTGEKVWFSMDITPIRDNSGQVIKFIAIQKDITERKEIQQELEKLSLVANKTNNGVIIADRDWKIEWVNEGFSKLTGYTSPEAAGNTPSELLHKHSQGSKAFNLLEEKLLKGESVSFEELIHKKSGEEAWVSVDITAIFDENGEPSRFIEVHTEITLLKEKELELSKLTTDLNNQNSDLQQFTYIVSHNLRAPVANALGLADLLTRADRNTDMFDLSLANLKESIVRLDTVMKDMNTILSIRDSKGNLETEDVSVRPVIEQVVSSLHASLSGCGGVVTNSIPEGLCVSANKAYLYSVFYNLLSNAIKYRSEERALAVSIKCINNTEKGTLISFSDNGSGFDLQKAQGNVFKLYKRFHADKKGRGIGLYLVRTHLEAIGGHVEVTSQIGAGTKFLIYLRKTIA